MVCRLGSFHTLMGFLGSIGGNIKGSGLEEVFELIYGPNCDPMRLGPNLVPAV